MLARVGVLAFLLLASSTAAATWAAYGGSEPSTVRDVEDPWMFEEPGPGSGPARIYFQAFLAVEGTSANPNVAALDSRFLPPGPVHHRALLGYWRDCNDDGYVGLAEGAILDYHATVPFDRTVCPVGSAHFDGQWVSEMIGIGTVDPCERATPEDRARCPGVDAFHPNERAYYAPGTMVWADVGAPGDVPGPECPLAPLPRATTSGTGAILAYVDCQIDRRVADALRTIDPDGALGIAFEDPEHPEDSSSPLNQRFPATPFRSEQSPGLLQEESGAPSATVWDCDDPRALRVADPTGGALDEVVVEDATGRLTGPQSALPVVGSLTLFEDHDSNSATPGVLRVPIANEGDLLWAPAPAVALRDPAGSWWDAAEGAADGARSDCDGETAARRAAPAPLVEGGDTQLDAAHKDRASVSFTWYDGHRGLNEANDHLLLGPAAPSDGGLFALRHGRGGVGPLWSADAASANEPQLVSRGTLEPTGPRRWTYYARLGDDALGNDTLLAPAGNGFGVYGNEACGTVRTGVLAGWVCDPGLWWRDALGLDARPRYSDGTPYAPVIGDRYHLRDVDCYDGHVAGGAFASLSPQSGSFC